MSPLGWITICHRFQQSSGNRATIGNGTETVLVGCVGKVAGTSRRVSCCAGDCWAFICRNCFAAFQHRSLGTSGKGTRAYFGCSMRVREAVNG